MPLYIVRWPLMRASLVRAQNEDHLMDILDEVASPTDCTWSMYNGPVWIDFEIAGVRHESKHPGPLEIDEVSIEKVEDAIAWPVVTLPSGDTVGEMIERIRTIAFPQVHKTLERFFEEEEDFDPDHVDASRAEAVRAAVARDEVQHDERRRRRSVTFDADARLKATKEICLYRRADGFRSVSSADVERFCFGRKRLPPDEDGYVKLAFVSVHHEPEIGWTARLASTIRLRVDAQGQITSAHRADAFGDDATSTLASFRDRRNAAVQWQMNGTDMKLLKAVVEKHAPGADLVMDENS